MAVFAQDAPNSREDWISEHEESVPSSVDACLSSSVPRKKSSSKVIPKSMAHTAHHGCIFDSDSATCMGEYFFTGTDSSVTKVEYTFGYKKDAEGNLKIVVHHSSLPYGS